MRKHRGREVQPPPPTPTPWRPHSGLEICTCCSTTDAVPWTARATRTALCEGNGKGNRATAERCKRRDAHSLPDLASVTCELQGCLTPDRAKEGFPCAVHGIATSHTAAQTLRRHKVVQQPPVPQVSHSVFLNCNGHT